MIYSITKNNVYLQSYFITSKINKYIDSQRVIKFILYINIR
jgi:hypothetical protein